MLYAVCVIVTRISPLCLLCQNRQNWDNSKNKMANCSSVRSDKEATISGVCFCWQECQHDPWGYDLLWCQELAMTKPRSSLLFGETFSINVTKPTSRATFFKQLDLELAIEEYKTNCRSCHLYYFTTCTGIINYKIVPSLVPEAPNWN